MLLFISPVSLSSKKEINAYGERRQYEFQLRLILLLSLS
jgi:hypothetical protein